MSIRRYITTCLTIGLAGVAGPASLRADEAMTRLAQRIHQIRQCTPASDHAVSVAARRIGGSNEGEAARELPERPSVPRHRAGTAEPRRLAEFKVPARPLAPARHARAQRSESSLVADELRAAEGETPTTEPQHQAVQSKTIRPAMPPVQVTLDVRAVESAEGDSMSPERGAEAEPCRVVARPADTLQRKTLTSRASTVPASSTGTMIGRTAAPFVPGRAEVVRRAPSGVITRSKAVAVAEAETVRVDRSGRPVRLYLPAAIEAVDVERGDVCRAWLSGAKEVTVVGIGEGTTGVTVRLRSAVGSRRFRIVVGDASSAEPGREERLNDVVRAAFASSDISVYAEHGRYVVEGTVPNEEEAIAVLSFVRGVCLHPVVDRLQVEKK